MSNNIFRQQFNKLLSEDINDDEEEFVEMDPEDEEAGEEAFQGSLSDDTDPKDFDVNPNSFKSINRSNIEEAKKWISILNDFADLINSVDNSDSLNHFLNRVDREGSAFRGVVRSQGKRVTRIAEEASAMAEVLGSHVVGSDRKERELLQQFPNLSK
jgi:hypothetical protein|tara:strand:+ start:46073 stop:46543 length:471 start_codon:yes stop_codon:yes gene_type:complete